MAKRESGKQLTIGDLLETHEYYDDLNSHWTFLRAAYNGAKALIEWGVLKQHERESVYNYGRRKDQAFGFGYTESIIELFNFYLFKEPVKRQLGTLADDELWTMFNQDCDLEGTDWDDFLNTGGKDSSIEGHMGILVDKANIDKVNELSQEKEEKEGDKSSRKLKTRQDAINNKVYPYVSAYRATDILDWEWDRDELNRPYLSYLKLLDEDGQYRLWWPDKWEIWEEPEIEGGVATNVTKVDNSDKKNENIRTDAQQQAVLVDSGNNPLGEIPFVWVYNLKSKLRGIGKSDVENVATIDGSIINNMSQCEEVIDYAAFPMMRKPKPEKGETPKDEAGVTAILEFDPELPDSKPDWLEAVVAEPVGAILDVVSKKIEEIYRASNVGGMASMEISTQAKSGAALKAEFQLLNSKLVSKGKQLVEAEKKTIYFWLKWQEQEELLEKVNIERTDTYDVASLMEDLENMITAKTIVKSTLFNQKLQKKTVRMMLPYEDDKELDKIDKEIDDWEPEEFTFEPFGEGGGGGLQNPGATKPPPKKDDKSKQTPGKSEE
jgi:hypothetical protein